MKKGDNFEQRLREEFQDHQTPMNLEAEWLALEARRSKKRKRPLFWMWWGSALVLISIITSWSIISFSTERLGDAATLSSSSPKPLTTSHLNTKNSTALANTSHSDQKIKSKEISVIANTSKTTQAISEAEQKLIIIPLTPKASSSPTPTISVANITSTVKTKASIKPQSISIPKNQTLLQAFALLPLKQQSLVPPSMSVDFDLKEIPRFQKANHRSWAIGLQTSYGKTFRTLRAEDTQNEVLINQRKNGEELLDVWSINMYLRKTLARRWFVDLGLGYRQATDRFQDVDLARTTTLLEDQLLSIIIRPDGSEEQEFGSVNADVQTKTTGTYYQYHRNAFIQLRGGREVPFGDQFGIQLSTGLNLSLFSAKEGTVFSNNPEVSYTNLNELEYRKAGLTEGLVQVELYFRTRSEWEFSIGLLGTQQLNNAFLKKSNILEHRGSLGLQLGLRKYISSNAR